MSVPGCRSLFSLPDLALCLRRSFKLDSDSRHRNVDIGTLVPVLKDYLVVPDWAVFAVRPPSRLQPVCVRAFTDFLEEKFRSVPSLAAR